MQYLSGYFWRREEEVSLVLKHLVYPGGEEPVLFGCLGQGEGAVEFCKNLTDWFYKEGVHCCKKSSVTPEDLQEKLRIQLQVQRDEWKTSQMEVPAEVDPEVQQKVPAGAVLCCVGEYFALWSSVGQQVFLLNTRFGRPNARLLTDSQREQFLCGRLQTGVGILLPASGVSQQMRTEELAECLAVKTLGDEIRLEKRLREIGGEAARRGAERVSSMLVMTC